jgi:hypothetical protein
MGLDEKSKSLATLDAPLIATFSHNQFDGQKLQTISDDSEVRIGQVTGQYPGLVDT